MTDRVLLDPELAPALASEGLDSVASLLALGGEPVRSTLVTEIPLPLQGTAGRFHLKRYLYPGWGKSRHLLGRGSLWGEAPEIREFRALTWLRAHDLPAVRPVAAASRRLRGRLAAHVLLTEHWPDARDLAVRLRDPDDSLLASPPGRRALLRRLGDRLGRMHALGFVHGDAYARNVLVRARGTSAEGEIAFLDCRRGGRPGPRRRPIRDLATLSRDLAAHVSRADRLRMIDAWRRASGEAPLRRLVRRVDREAGRLDRSDARRGRVRR